MKQIGIKKDSVVGIVELLVTTELCGNKHDAINMLNQGAVVCEGERIFSEDATITFDQDKKVFVGKRRSVEMVVN